MTIPTPTPAPKIPVVDPVIAPVVEPLVAPVIPAEELADIDIKDPEPVVGVGVDQVALRIEQTAIAEQAGFEQAFQDIRDMKARVFEAKPPEPERTIRELRTEILAEWGVTPEAFQEIRGLATKQKPLLDEMAALKTEERELLAQVEGRMASMTWIRGEQRMIQERFEGRRADVSAQLGVLSMRIETLRGNLTEARAIANDVIEAATYDQEREYRRFTNWYNRNWAFIQDLDKDIRKLYDNYLERVETNRREAKEYKRLITGLMLENPRAGINIQDTFEEATQKAADFRAKLPAEKDWELRTIDNKLYRVDPATGETKLLIDIPRQTGIDRFSPAQLRRLEMAGLKPETITNNEAASFFGIPTRDTELRIIQSRVDEYIENPILVGTIETLTNEILEEIKIIPEEEVINMIIDRIREKKPELLPRREDIGEVSIGDVGLDKPIIHDLVGRGWDFLVGATERIKGWFRR